MKILAIDTTAKTVAAALCEDEALLGEITVNAKNTHSETMLPTVERLLTAFSLTPRDIELFAVTRGPGSFTGVRIGAATVKGLAMRDAGEAPVPIASVSTIEALAYNFAGLGSPEAPVTVVPVMDARRMQVYTGAFKVTGERPERILEDSALSIEELFSKLTELSPKDPIYFVGDGYAIAAEHFAQNGGSLKVIPTPQNLIWPRGSSIALCGLDTFRRGEAVDETALIPSYLRGV